eukprot:4932988-Prymnesium_polylepis.1
MNGRIYIGEYGTIRAVRVFGSVNILYDVSTMKLSADSLYGDDDVTVLETDSSFAFQTIKMLYYAQCGDSLKK